MSASETAKIDKIGFMLVVDVLGNVSLERVECGGYVLESGHVERLPLCVNLRVEKWKEELKNDE
jgi:hypothetical protein